MGYLGIGIILIGVIFLYKEAKMYEKGNIVSRSIDVGRLEDKAAFCRYAVRYTKINMLLVIALLASFLIEEIFPNMTYYMLNITLMLIFISRTFYFSGAAKRFYKKNENVQG